MTVFIANAGSRLVHTADCEFAWASMEMEIVHDLADAYSAGYREAGCCLGEAPTRAFEVSRLIKQEVRAHLSSCAICGRNGRIELAHIVPKRLGGKRRVPLCPNHHQAFDFGELNADDLRVLEKHCVKSFGMLARDVRQCHGAGRAAA